MQALPTFREKVYQVSQKSPFGACKCEWTVPSVVMRDHLHGKQFISSWNRSSDDYCLPDFCVPQSYFMKISALCLPRINFHSSDGSQTKHLVKEKGKGRARSPPCHLLIHAPTPPTLHLALSKSQIVTHRCSDSPGLQKVSGEVFIFHVCFCLHLLPC